jgi:outer membrane receptor protein involved in Fe transport
LRYYNGNANILDYDGNPVLNAVGNPADSFDPVNAPGVGPYNPNSFLTKNLNNSALSGRLGLNYQFSGAVMGYASYSRGYRAGAVNGGGYLGNNLVTLVEPEKVDAFEGGVKSELFDHHLRLNVAGFYYNYKNQQLQEVLGAVAVLRNAPKSTLYGLEIEATARLTDTLTANASLGVLHTKYDGLVLSGVNLDGNRLPFAPTVSLNGGFDWTAMDFGSGKLTMSPNVSYTSQQWFTPANGRPSTTTDTIGNGRLQQSGYWLVGGNVGLQMENGLYARAWVKNLFNKGYTVYGLDLRASFGYDYLALGAPRSYGLTIGYKF